MSIKHQVVVRLAVLVALLAFGLAPLSAGAVVGVPANATITSATFSIYVDLLPNLGGDKVVHVHRVTSLWTESAVTWNARTQASNWSAPGGDFDPVEVGSFTAALGWNSVDVTAFIQGIVNGTHPNFGLLLRQNPINDTRYKSGESPVIAERPKLEICYTTPSNPTPTCLLYQQDVLGHMLDSTVSTSAPNSTHGNQVMLRTTNVPAGEKRALVQHNFQIVP